jgi:hypothetical protein
MRASFLPEIYLSIYLSIQKSIYLSIYLRQEHASAGAQWVWGLLMSKPAVSYRSWRAQAALGYCASTKSEGDCSKPGVGMLGLDLPNVPPRLLPQLVPVPRLHQAVRQCLAKCAACSSCQYISVSLLHADCSWYSSCPLDHLRKDVGGFISGPSLALLNASGFAASWEDMPRLPKPGLKRACSDATTGTSPAPPASKLNGVSSMRLLHRARQRKGRRVALLQVSDGPRVAYPRPRVSDDARRLDLTNPSTWARADPPCSSQLFELLVAATNRAYALQHGYDYYEGRADCRRQAGRAPTWCKVALIYGLLHERLTPSPTPIDWVVYLDTDACFNTQYSLQRWLTHRPSLSSSGQDLGLKELLRSGCSADSHRASELSSACAIFAKDVLDWGGVNAGVVLAASGRQTLRLLRKWWAWPGASEDGSLAYRRRYEPTSAPQGTYDQMGLNAVDGGLLTRAAAACVRVVPSSELYDSPGRLIRHFSGGPSTCPIASQYLPRNRSTLPYGPKRKCLCFLSHFGARIIAQRFQDEAFAATTCESVLRRIDLGEARDDPSRGPKTLAATYTRHALQCNRTSIDVRHAQQTHAPAASAGGNAPLTTLSDTSYGYCAATVDGDNGDCDAGVRGSWMASEAGVQTLAECADLCGNCSRCNYVSFSLAGNDCSWHHSCSLEKLHADVGDFQSRAVPPWVARKRWRRPVWTRAERAPGRNLTAAIRGLCAKTWQRGDCESDGSGSFTGRIASLEACEARCRTCTRCAFVSYSRLANDCSWYTRCDLDDLRRPPPYATHGSQTPDRSVPLTRSSLASWTGTWQTSYRPKSVHCRHRCSLLRGPRPAGADHALVC